MCDSIAKLSKGDRAGTRTLSAPRVLQLYLLCFFLPHSQMRHKPNFFQKKSSLAFNLSSSVSGGAVPEIRKDWFCSPREAQESSDRF